ncbi:MAG: hypothetical protein PHS26_12390, partial [Actinomycetota bacterium]|nr:hypothetical protein [Actinomycetota bacterium]
DLFPTPSCIATSIRKNAAQGILCSEERTPFRQMFCQAQRLSSWMSMVLITKFRLDGEALGKRRLIDTSFGPGQ